MLIVKPILDKDIQKELGDICGVKFDADCLAFSAFDEDKLVGFCQFSVAGGVATLTDLKSAPGISDFEAMFIMSRGALNYMDLCGFHFAKCLPNAGELSLIKSIGFKENSDGIFEVDLTKEFTSHCTHCK